MREVTRVYRPIAGPLEWSEALAALGRRVPSAPEGSGPRYRRILIPTLVGVNDLFTIREGLVAHALRQRGAEVIFVLCDGFPACDARTQEHDPPDFCASCFPRGLDSLEALGLASVSVSSLVPPERARQLWRLAEDCSSADPFTFHYGGIPLGRHVYASTLRHFGAGFFDWDDPVFVDRARRDLAVALFMTEAAREACRKLAPDKLVAAHPGYAFWGPWVDMTRAAGIPADTYHAGWRRNTVMAHHETSRTFHCDDLWTRFRERPLDEEQERRLDDWLIAGEGASGDFRQFLERVDRDIGALPERLGLSSRGWTRVCCALADVCQDAADYEQRGAFRSSLDWLGELIDWFAARPTALLLIRTDAAERSLGAGTPQRWRVAERIAERHRRLPDNVRLLAPESLVLERDALAGVDLLLVNNSPRGLDLALAGATVITTGRGAHYEKPGLVLYPRTREAYFELLTRAVESGLDFRPDVELARRYAYTLYFRKHLPFEALDVAELEPVGLGVERLAQLRPGAFAGLDALCEGILEDAPFGLED